MSQDQNRDGLLANLFNAFDAVRNFITPAKPSWFSVQNSATSAEIVIDGPIGKSWYDDSGVSSKEFRNALDKIPVGKPLHVRINSEGGAIDAGLAIYNMLQARKADVTCTVEGYALSSASFIALGGGRTVVPKSAILMTHLPWTMTIGDDAAHAKAAEMLKVHGEVIAGIYAGKTGKPKAEMLDMMKKETWLGGEECLALGLADATGTGDEEDDEEAENSARTKVASLPQHLAQHEKGLLNKRTNELYFNVPANVMNAFRAASGSQPTIAQSSKPDETAPVISASGEGAESGTAGSAVSNSTPETTLPVVMAGQTDQDMSNQTTPVAATPAPAPVNQTELAELRAALNREKKARIEAKLDTFISQCRLTNDERPDALNRAMTDESYLDVIAKRPNINAGGMPIGPGVFQIEVMDDVFHQIKAEKSAPARLEMRRQNWDRLYLHAKSIDGRGAGVQGASNLINLPVNANSVASALIVDFLADLGITQLVAVLPSLRIFTRDFAASPMAPLNTVQVALTTQGGQLQKATKANVNATGAITNYESGDHTLTNVPVTLSEYSEAFQLTSQELMSGLRIERFANHALQTLGKNIIVDTLQVFNQSTFTAGVIANGTVSAHYGTWGWNVSGASAIDMGALRAAIGASPEKNAVLDPTFFSKLITINVVQGIPLGVGLKAGGFKDVFGWNEVQESSAWPANMGLDNTVGSTVGLACNPQAVAVAARLPILPPEGIPGNTLVQSQILIPGVEISVALFQWFNVSTRTLWHSFGLVYGAAAGDTTAACMLKTLGA